MGAQVFTLRVEDPDRQQEPPETFPTVVPTYVRKRSGGFPRVYVVAPHSMWHGGGCRRTRACPRPQTCTGQQAAEQSPEGAGCGQACGRPCATPNSSPSASACHPRPSPTPLKSSRTGSRTCVYLLGASDRMLARRRCNPMSRANS